MFAVFGGNSPMGRGKYNRISVLFLPLSFVFGDYLSGIQIEQDEQVAGQKANHLTN
jgi:hypothetical protein